MHVGASHMISAIVVIIFCRSRSFTIQVFLGRAQSWYSKGIERYALMHGSGVGHIYDKGFRGTRS